MDDPTDPMTHWNKKPRYKGQKRLTNDLSCLKGIGPKRADLFRARGINTVKDLLYFFPLRYEDRREAIPIGELRPGEQALVWGRIRGGGEERVGSSRKKVFKIEIEDGTGTLQVLWFNYRPAYLWQVLERGKGLAVYGRVKAYGKTLQMIHPDVEKTESRKSGFLRPIYPSVKGLSQKVIAKAVQNALEGCAELVVDPIPVTFTEKLRLPRLYEAIKCLHLPPATGDFKKFSEGRTKYHERIQFDRFIGVVLAVLKKRYERSSTRNVGPYSLPVDLLEKFQANLPFDLTPDQTRAIKEICQDLEKDSPMMRLLQGDVGCGKTVVAAAAAYAAILNHRQVALMAPTQILARQHFVFFSNLPETLGFKPLFVTGALRAEEKARAYEMMRHGDCNFIVGTQALVQEEVRFQDLGLVIIDEQHRFGVRQRSLLAQKAEAPDVLVMTATPIPRTLAIILYADLNISVIRSRPPGYKGVITRIMGEGEKRKIYEMVTGHMERGEQVMVICPVIQGTEDQDLRDAVNMYDALKALYEPRFRVGLIHGEMPPGEKDTVMQKFHEGKIQLLVSTTVVEVGVHAPGATVMVVEHPERFGLAQLHQLRGRVGRGEKQGLCLLVKRDGISGQAEKRLKVLASCDDGFVISEQDLLFRGHGEVMGLRQAGPGEIDISEVLNNQHLLMAAKEVAEKILREDPELSGQKYRYLRMQLEEQFGVDMQKKQENNE